MILNGRYISDTYYGTHFGEKITSSHEIFAVEIVRHCMVRNFIIGKISAQAKFSLVKKICTLGKLPSIRYVQ